MGYSFGNKVLENGSWVVVRGYTFLVWGYRISGESVTPETRVVAGLLGIVTVVTLYLYSYTEIIR